MRPSPTTHFLAFFWPVLTAVSDCEETFIVKRYIFPYAHPGNELTDEWFRKREQSTTSGPTTSLPETIPLHLLGRSLAHDEEPLETAGQTSEVDTDHDNRYLFYNVHPGNETTDEWFRRQDQASEPLEIGGRMLESDTDYDGGGEFFIYDQPISKEDVGGANETDYMEDSTDQQISKDDMGKANETDYLKDSTDQSISNGDVGKANETDYMEDLTDQQISKEDVGKANETDYLKDSTDQPISNGDVGKANETDYMEDSAAHTQTISRRIMEAANDLMTLTADIFGTFKNVSVSAMTLNEIANNSEEGRKMLVEYIEPEFNEEAMAATLSNIYLNLKELAANLTEVSKELGNVFIHFHEDAKDMPNMQDLPQDYFSPQSRIIEISHALEFLTLHFERMMEGFKQLQKERENTGADTSSFRQNKLEFDRMLIESVTKLHSELEDLRSVLNKIALLTAHLKAESAAAGKDSKDLTNLLGLLKKSTSSVNSIDNAAMLLDHMDTNAPEEPEPVIEED